MLKLLDCSQDSAEWETTVARFTSDPHYLPAYYRAYGNGKLIVYHEGEGPLIIQPFMDQEPGWIGNAYNFGGPVGGCNRAANFSYEFDAWKLDQKLSERCSRSPLMTGCPMSGSLYPDVEFKTKETVYVDLTKTLKLRSTTRHCIEKARNADVLVKRYETPAQVKAFTKIYNDAIERKNGADYWKYKSNFFGSVLSGLGTHNSALFLSSVGEDVESGCILIFDSTNCYYHWAATNGKHSDVGVNHLQVVECLSWARARGLKRFFLGGGITENDGIFTFKAGFSELRLKCESYTKKYKEVMVA